MNVPHLSATNIFFFNLLIDVIATVGPIAPPEQPDVLASCYRRSLQVLVSNQLKTIAFPCISTGVYGFDKERAANVALGTTRQFLESNDGASVNQKRYG